MNKIFLNIGGYNSTIIDFPESAQFKDVFCLNSIDDVVRATINFDSGKSAELSKEDIKRILDLYWNFTMIRYTVPYEPEYDYSYFNFYDKDNNKYTIFGYGKILCSSFGNDNYMWYMPYIGNARQIFYTMTSDLSKKYYDMAISSEETPNTFTNYDNINFRLPKDEQVIKEIKEAASNNILPYELTTQYEKSITREEFCTIIAYMLSKIYGERSNSLYIYSSLDHILLDIGIINEDNIYDNKKDITFFDYESPSDIVKDLYLLGITSGKENNTFEPYSNITQEEAAQLLYNVNKLLKNNADSSNLDYLNEDISPWAKEAISWVSQNDIMSWIFDDNFEPKLSFTREQAIVSINRLYKKCINKQ